MKKVVVYGATRNIYSSAIPCINSALQNGNVDTVILLDEGGNDIRLLFPGRDVRTVDVSGQTFFDALGANARKRWTYMTLMRAALSKLFPEFDRVLWLDCDTIVEGDLSPLWDVDLTGYYFGAVRQFSDGRDGRFMSGDYFNAGVLLCNLAALRDGKDDELIASLNTHEWDFCEQDAINMLCKGKIKPIAPFYNVSQFTLDDNFDAVIRHFAADGTWLTGYYGQKYNIPKEVE